MCHDSSYQCGLVSTLTMWYRVSKWRTTHRSMLLSARASFRVVELYIGCSRGCADTAAMAFLIDGQIDTRLAISLLKLHITNASTMPGAYESSFCFLNSFHINLASSHCLISIVLNSILLFVGSLVRTQLVFVWIAAFFQLGWCFCAECCECITFMSLLVLTERP